MNVHFRERRNDPFDRFMDIRNSKKRFVPKKRNPGQFISCKFRAENQSYRRVKLGSNSFAQNLCTDASSPPRP